MRRWRIGLWLPILVIAAQLPRTSGLAAEPDPLTCKIKGELPFPLDDSDFVALADAGVTKENFASLPISKRKAICEARLVWRRIVAGKADDCDFARYNPVSIYFGKSERSAAIKAASKPHTGECRY